MTPVSIESKAITFPPSISAMDARLLLLKLAANAFLYGLVEGDFKKPSGSRPALTWLPAAALPAGVFASARRPAATESRAFEMF